MTRPALLLVTAAILVACARQAPRPESAAASGLPNLSLVK